MPAWLRDGSQGFTGMNTIPYVLAGPTAVAGFLFAYPLQAGTDRTKILWVAGRSRLGLNRRGAKPSVPVQWYRT